MKYAITEGNAQIKNGAAIENANQYYPVSIGSFNRTFVGTTVGSVKVLFTVRNKTTLIEKTQLISVAVNPSDFSFNATRTNTGQVVNTPVIVNLNLTQTGGTGDTYSLMFNTSSTGTFKYGGITYTAGQVIPFVIGASTGEYIGSVSGNHDITFTATNQLNISKTALVSINYINNNFTLSSSGDGTLYVNQTKDFNVFLSQLIPDASLTYQVKYSFDTGTTGSGTITNGGSPVALGSYQPIALGSNLLTFNASSLGIVNLLIEVKNSNGLLKSTVVMFDIKNVSFSLTLESKASYYFLNEKGALDLKIAESSTSGTNYEMKYSLSSGTADVDYNGSTQLANQWTDVNLGTLNTEVTALSEQTIIIIFTLRNKITQEVKNLTVSLNPYRKPTLTNFRTGYSEGNAYNCGGGSCSRWANNYISFTSNKSINATITSISITLNYGNAMVNNASLGTKTFNLTNYVTSTVNETNDTRASARTGYMNFDNFSFDGNGYWFHDRPYTITITDSNGFSSTYTRTYTASLADFQ